MKKTIKIIGVASLIIGVLIAFGTMVAIGFDFEGLADYEEKALNISEQFDSISIDAESIDVVIKPSENEKCILFTKTKNGTDVECTVQNGVLKIKETEDFSGFFSYGSNSLILYLPRDSYHALTINSATTDVQISQINFDLGEIKVSTGNVKIDSSINKLSLKASTGDININGMDGDTVSAVTSTGDIAIRNSAIGGNVIVEASTGDITVENVDVGGDLKIKVSTGDIAMMRATAHSVSAESSTGDMELENVIASKEMMLKASSGEIEFDRCDAETLSIQTSSGDVEGTLLTSKIFYAISDSGDISVPQSTQGGLCRVQTESGDIEISIRK